VRKQQDTRWLHKITAAMTSAQVLIDLGVTGGPPVIAADHLDKIVTQDLRCGGKIRCSGPDHDGSKSFMAHLLESADCAKFRQPGYFGWAYAIAVGCEHDSSFFQGPLARHRPADKRNHVQR
jgi:hypothetical protein